MYLIRVDPVSKPKNRVPLFFTELNPILSGGFAAPYCLETVMRILLVDSIVSTIFIL